MEEESANEATSTGRVAYFLEEAVRVFLKCLGVETKPDQKDPPSTQEIASSATKQGAEDHTPSATTDPEADHPPPSTTANPDHPSPATPDQEADPPSTTATSVSPANPDPPSSTDISVSHFFSFTRLRSLCK
jgi:hypothetical protein